MSLLRLRRLVAPLLAVVTIGSTVGTAATILLPTAAFAESSYSMESEFIAKLNGAREANGQRPYSVAGDLTAVARAHSQAMASQSSLYHNPSLTTAIPNWQAVGENVGEGPDVNDVHVAFMNSPEHRANILDHDFTQVGVGVSVDHNGIVWVTEDFREPMSSAPAPAVHSSTPTSHHSAPAPAPVSSVSQPAAPTWSSSAPTHPVAHLRPAPSPRAILLRRLHQLRLQHHHISGDPVAQSFVYVKNLSRLAA